MEISPGTKQGWQPPDGFIPASSAVGGITVYMPRPQEVEPQGLVTYQCPNCGAATRYDVAAGGVACEYCGYRAPAKAEQVGRRAQEFEFTLETVQLAEQGWGVARQELHCENCGASITLAEGTLTVTCPFCASNHVNVRPAPADQLRPRFLIPFKLQLQQVSSRAAEWLGKGWFHPADLSKAAAVDRFSGIYLPFWTFDSAIDANWKAEVGYERQERYYDAGSKEWQTRTVIDWRWESGEVTVNVDDLLIVGTTRASRIILERLQPFNFADLVAYQPDFLAGWQAQAYDINLNDAWEEAKNRMREQAKNACREDIHSGHVRNFSMLADFRDETWRYVLLPVYLAAYRFDGKTYQVMVNGQTGTVAGQKPVAWWKIWLAIALLLGPGLGLSLISLPLLLAGGLGLVPLIIGIILLVIGGILSFNLYRQAIASEAA